MIYYVKIFQWGSESRLGLENKKHRAMGYSSYQLLGSGTDLFSELYRICPFINPSMEDAKRLVG
jgi:hypothetical protein